MDISRELLSLRRRAMEHSIKENVPTLSMPIINEGDPMPEASIWSLPIIIEKKKDNFNGTEED
tara:strand:+ start:1000 stop:1188 length:189 start_codon:yes stop_codon:yes gene_type:complete